MGLIYGWICKLSKYHLEEMSVKVTGKGESFQWAEYSTGNLTLHNSGRRDGL